MIASMGRPPGQKAASGNATFLPRLQPPPERIATSARPSRSFPTTAQPDPHRASPRTRVMPLDKGQNGFTLSKLPYAEEALAPVISAKTISFHYGKHHKAYVDKLN